MLHRHQDQRYVKNLQAVKREQQVVEGAGLEGYNLFKAKFANLIDLIPS